MKSTKTTNLDLQMFEQACLALNHAGFSVQVACATTPQGVMTQGVRLSLNHVGWCRQCHRLKTVEEMARPGRCQTCASAERKAAEKAVAPEAATSL